MKSFNDFYTSTSADFDKFLKELIKEEFPTGEIVSPMELAGKLLSANSQLTLERLRLYHDWLSEQLDK